ncbi:sugar nucleotide-binding protein [Streptomyces sp. NPDC005281]|uniref:SDR family oxidoreductase n=1 Tax=Streptomyces sp. NPDC005281 TaxID=3155712 RepID=UPI0033B076A0
MSADKNTATPSQGSTTLVVGSGFVGRALAAHLAAKGEAAVLASRCRPNSQAGPWVRLDATDAVACERVIDEIQPDRLVFVHGPSDVSWCQSNPKRAAEAHTAAAINLTAAARGRRTVLISTDNVFDGNSPANDETATTAPANAYGQAKLAAEQIVRESTDATVLRVSLVYGWEPADSAKWLNFFAACAHRLQRGGVVEAPHDQWTTPVLVDDVAAVSAAALTPGTPELLHLGGPDRVTRAEWAEAIADGLGAPRSRIIRTPKALGRYASRPTYTCLTSTLLDGFCRQHTLQVRGVAEGIRDLLKVAP